MYNFKNLIKVTNDTIIKKTDVIIYLYGYKYLVPEYLIEDFINYISKL